MDNDDNNVILLNNDIKVEFRFYIEVRFFKEPCICM